MTTETEGVDTPTEAPALTTDAIAGIVEAKLAAALAPLQEVTDAAKNKIQRRNDTLAQEGKSKDERIAALEAQIHKFGGSDGDPAKAVEQKQAMLDLMRNDLAAQVAEVETLKGQFQETQTKLRRRELEDSVLGGVDPGQREAAAMMLEGSLSRRGVDIGTVDNLEALGSELSAEITKHLSAVAPTPKQAGDRATPSQPDALVDPAKANWAQYKSWQDVPANLRAHVPEEEFARMAQPGPVADKGGVGGMLI